MSAGKRAARKTERRSERRATARLELDFPARLVTQPLLYHLVKKFDLVPNIRRANITQKFGYIQLELQGRARSLEQGIQFLIRRGVRVEPIMKDVLES